METISFAKQDRSTLTDEHCASDLSLSDISKKKDVLDRKKTLKKKLKEAADQNVTLEDTITTKNAEIKQLKKSVESLNEVINSVPIEDLRNNSSIASTKIVELSKRNRQLRVELESTKNKCNRQEIQIRKLESDLKSASSIRKDIPSKTPPNTSNEDLVLKINAIQQKLFESRNINVELRNQLKLANKCLQQEIGETFNLNLLASAAAQSTWRGRAQQIIGLQQKVTELKEKLDQCQLQAKDTTCLSPTNSQNTGAGDNFCRQLTSSTNIRKQEVNHRARIEHLEKEIASLKEQLEEQRTKLLALKVRNKTLTDEAIKYKMRACSLEEQTDCKGSSISKLNEKLNIQRYQYENRIQEINKEVATLIKQQGDSELQQEQLKIAIQNMHVILSEKEDFIQTLNNTILKLEDDLKSICGEYLFSCRELRKEEFVAILDSLESEKNNLIDLNKVLNERLKHEREKYENLSEQSTKQKIRISRLEAKIRDIEKEHEVLAEKKKRSQRMLDYANSVNIASSSYPGSLPTFVFENSATSGNDILGVHDNDHKLKIVELENNLELAKEKITILEEKISYITEEKQNDAKMFEDIVKNTKNLLLDTILEHHSNEQDN